MTVGFFFLCRPDPICAGQTRAMGGERTVPVSCVRAYYPLRRHQPKELHVTVSGGFRFERHGKEEVWVGPGDVVFTERSEIPAPRCARCCTVDDHLLGRWTSSRVRTCQLNLSFETFEVGEREVSSRAALPFAADCSQGRTGGKVTVALTCPTSGQFEKQGNKFLARTHE